MISKIKEILQRGVLKEDFPGASFCILKDGKIECDFVGYKQLYPSKKRLDGDEIYDVASLSKVLVTTILVFKIIELGLINLETNISNILPDFKHKNIKVKDLLLHQSGLSPIIHNNINVNTKEELINQIYREPLVYEKGNEIRYSDTGFMLLGLLIEKTLNMSLDKVADKYIFKPLKLKKTTYKPDKNKSVPTEMLEDETFVQGYVHDERARLLDGVSGHAGLFSTPYEISLIMKSILKDNIIINDHNKKLIFEKTLIKKDVNDNYLVRTYGFQKYDFLKEDYKNLITHTGFTGCNLWIDKDTKTAFVLLTNAVHPLRKYNKIFNYRIKILKLFYIF